MAIAMSAAATFAAAVLGYGLYAAIIGFQTTLVSEGGEMTPVLVQSGTGWIFAVAGAVVLIGLARPSRMLAWAGAVMIMVYGGLAIFSTGLPMMVIGAALLVALASREMARWSATRS